MVEGVVSEMFAELVDREPINALIACVNVPRRSRITKLAVDPDHIEELSDLFGESLIISRT
ncbi:unnamed protein product, partial [marine sediment metagenome]